MDHNKQGIWGWISSNLEFWTGQNLLYSVINLSKIKVESKIEYSDTYSEFALFSNKV